MNDLVLVRPATIGDDTVDTVDSVHLHAALEVETDHCDWIKRRLRLANLREHFDFEVFLNSAENPSGGRPEVHYVLTLDASKHIAMMEKTDVAFDVRRFFIEREKQGRLGTDRIIEAAKLAAVEIVESHIRLLRSEITGRDMFTLARWTKEQKVVLSPRQSRAIGGALAAKSRVLGMPMGYEPSAHPHGRPPRTFTRTVLTLHFARLVEKHVPSSQLALVASVA